MPGRSEVFFLRGNAFLANEIGRVTISTAGGEVVLKQPIGLLRPLSDLAAAWIEGFLASEAPDFRRFIGEIDVDDDTAREALVLAWERDVGRLYAGEVLKESENCYHLTDPPVQEFENVPPRIWTQCGFISLEWVDGAWLPLVPQPILDRGILLGTACERVGHDLLVLPDRDGAMICSRCNGFWR
jgi:hypothetical protein